MSERSFEVRYWELQKQQQQQQQQQQQSLNSNTKSTGGGASNANSGNIHMTEIDDAVARKTREMDASSNSNRSNDDHQQRQPRPHSNQSMLTASPHAPPQPLSRESSDRQQQQQHSSSSPEPNPAGNSSTGQNLSSATPLQQKQKEQRRHYSSEPMEMTDARARSSSSQRAIHLNRMEEEEARRNAVPGALSREISAPIISRQSPSIRSSHQPKAASSARHVSYENRSASPQRATATGRAAHLNRLEAEARKNAESNVRHGSQSTSTNQEARLEPPPRKLSSNRRSLSPRSSANARAAHLSRLEAEARKNAKVAPKRRHSSEPGTEVAASTSGSRRSISPNQRASANARAAHLSRLEAEARKNAEAPAPTRRRSSESSTQPAAAAAVSSGIRRSVSPNQRASANARAAHLSRLEAEARKNAEASAPTRRRSSESLIQQKETGAASSRDRRSVSPRVSANARTAHLSRLEGEARKNAEASAPPGRRSSESSTQPTAAAVSSGSRRSISPNQRASANARAAHLSRLEAEARKNAEAGPIRKLSATRKLSSGNQRSNSNKREASSHSRPVQLNRMEEEATERVLGRSKSSDMELSTSVRSQRSTMSADDVDLQSDRQLSETRSSRSMQANHHMEARKGASDRGLRSAQRSSSKGKTSLRASSARSVQLNRLEAEILEMGGTGANNHIMFSASTRMAAGASSTKAATMEQLHRMETEARKSSGASSTRNVGVASRNSINEELDQPRDKKYAATESGQQNSAHSDALPEQLSRLEAEVRKQSGPGGPASPYASGPPSTTKRVDQMEGPKIKNLSNAASAEAHSSSALQQLDTMEDSILLKGNASRVDMARQQSQLDESESSYGSTLPHPTFLHTQPLRSVSRREAKSDYVLEPGALGPGAYRAGQFQDDDAENESLTYSDRLLFQTDASEREFEELAASGSQSQPGNSAQEPHLLAEITPHVSVAESYSDQLRFDINGLPEYGSEQAQQTVDIKSGRSCRIILLVIIALVVLGGIGIGLGIALTGASELDPAETGASGDTERCLHDLNLFAQCEANDYISNIPTCVHKRYETLQRELGLVSVGSNGGLHDHCSPENLGLLSMAAKDQPPHISNYALSVFFYSTGGPASWKRKDNWLTASNVCSWYGVSCELVCTDDGTGSQSCDLDPDRVTILNLEKNRLGGSLPSTIGLLSSLKTLHMVTNELTGTIPHELGLLTELLSLNLSHNLALKGTIPLAIWTHKQLQILSAISAQLSGTIPTEIGLMSSLGVFDLASNRLDGTLPSEIGNLSLLQSFYGYSNGFSGSIPSTIARCTELRSIILSENDFTGKIPTEFGLLTTLEILAVGSNRFEKKAFPVELTQLTNLKELSLESCNISGSLPTELGGLHKMYGFFMTSNLMTGTIPSELGKCESLSSLLLDVNSLTGSIPTELGDLSNLTELSIALNRLSGQMPSELGRLQNLKQLVLHTNLLTGLIPEEVCSLRDFSLVALGTSEGYIECLPSKYGGASCPTPECCRGCKR